MSLRKLFDAAVPARPKNLQWDAPSDAMEKWAARPLAADENADGVITIFDVIGEDFWSGGGFTAKRMAAALRANAKREVTVKINSPGGDMFEGVAIYNLLREHPQKVTVHVLGLAASAASIIAMAADEIVMGGGSFMMIHNAWGMVIGNRHDMGDAAGLFEKFDGALADIYEARTGRKRGAIEEFMDAETFFGAAEAVREGFADAADEKLVAAAAPETKDNRRLAARRKTEAALARAGLTRNDRSALLADMIGAAPRDAGRNSAARDAGAIAGELSRLIATLKS